MASSKTRDEEWGEDKPSTKEEEEATTILLGYVQPILPNTGKAPNPQTASQKPQSLAHVHNSHENWLRWTDQDSQTVHQDECPRRSDPGGDKGRETSVLVIDDYPDRSTARAAGVYEPGGHKSQQGSMFALVQEEPSGRKSQQGSILAHDLEYGSAIKTCTRAGSMSEPSPSYSNRVVLPVNREVSVLAAPQDYPSGATTSTAGLNEPSGIKIQHGSIFALAQEEPSGRKSQQGSILAHDLEYGSHSSAINTYTRAGRVSKQSPSCSNRVVPSVKEETSILVPPQNNIKCKGKGSILVAPLETLKGKMEDANTEGTVAVEPIGRSAINTEGTIVVPPMGVSSVNIEGTISAAPMGSSKTNREESVAVAPMGVSMINAETSIAVAPIGDISALTADSSTPVANNQHPSSNSRGAPKDSVLSRPVETVIQKQIRESLKSPQERECPRKQETQGRRNVSYMVYGVYLMVLLVVVGAVILAIFLVLMPKQGSDGGD